MKYVDKFLFSRKGNLAFDDTVKLNFSNEPDYLSLLEMVNIFNALYLQCAQESDLSIEELEEKRKLLKELYNYFKNTLIFYDKGHNFSTSIDDNSTTFSIGFGDFYGDYTSLIVKLGENFGLDYENSTYYENNKKIALTKEEWNKIFNTTYIHKKYIKK